MANSTVSFPSLCSQEPRRITDACSLAMAEDLNGWHLLFVHSSGERFLVQQELSSIKLPYIPKGDLCGTPHENITQAIDYLSIDFDFTLVRCECGEDRGERCMLAIMEIAQEEPKGGSGFVGKILGKLL